MPAKKLILFDIDGTLIRHFGEPLPWDRGWARFIYAAKKVYGVDIIPDVSKNYYGHVDRSIFFDIVKNLGVSKVLYDEKFKDAATALYEYAQLHESKQMYEAIPEAVELLHKLVARPTEFFVGVLTGNIEKMAYWKLEHVGIDTKLFSIFITSDEYEDRISLAKSTFAKLEKEAGLIIKPEDTVVIGDAVGDVRCAKAIGAVSIIAMTGKHKREELEVEQPDFLVESLADRSVLEYFHSTRTI